MTPRTTTPPASKLTPRRTRRYRELDRFIPLKGRLNVTQQCRARVALPNAKGEGDVLFTCNMPKGHADAGAAPQSDHVERGRVRRKDGTTAGYTFVWHDEAPEVWR